MTLIEQDIVGRRWERRVPGAADARRERLMQPSRQRCEAIEQRCEAIEKLGRASGSARPPRPAPLRGAR